MPSPFPNIDLTVQRQQLASTIYTAINEIWSSDSLVWCLSYVGLLDVSFESTEPTDIRKLWLDRTQAPTLGTPGILKWWDAELEEWVAIKPADWAIYNRQAVAPRWFYSSEFDFGQVRPADVEVRVGDYWEHDTGSDNELSIFRMLSPNNLAWVDLTGGVIDQDALAHDVIDGGSA